MSGKEKMQLDVKWATRQRLEYIEVMAYYTGVVSRSDVAQAFGLSDAAATKDLKLYNDLAPDNLIYRHNVFGFVPADDFQAQFADLSPARVLPMMAANLASAGHTQHVLYGLAMEALPLPVRLPEQAILAQITRAIRARQKLLVNYHSLSERDNPQQRILEPHSLVNTGLRWHVRAYSEESYDFRDFVLSRFAEAHCLDEAAESSIEFDDDWVEQITLELVPHPGLDSKRKASLMQDFAMDNGLLGLEVRRALLGYVLQRLTVDTTHNHSMNPRAYQLALNNRDEIEPFASWLFND